MKIFLDDHLIPLAYSWTIVKTVEEFKKIVLKNRNEISAISLDHDLGDETTSGMDAANFMVENKIYPEWINVHSMNPVGAQNIFNVLEKEIPEDSQLTRVFIKSRV